MVFFGQRGQQDCARDAQFGVPASVWLSWRRAQLVSQDDVVRVVSGVVAALWSRWFCALLVRGFPRLIRGARGLCCRGIKISRDATDDDGPGMENGSRNKRESLEFDVGKRKLSRKRWQKAV